MKPGDLVEKFSGDWDLGKVGCLIKIEENSIGVKLVYVLVDGQIKTWSANFVRKCDEID